MLWKFFGEGGVLVTMATMKVDRIDIRSNDGTIGQGELQTSMLTQADRLRRTAKGLLICLGLGVLVVFIPVFHWVLVPVALLAMPVVGFYTYRTRSIVERAAGECPECRATVTLALAPQTRIPHWTYCPACNKPLQLVYHSGSV